MMARKNKQQPKVIRLVDNLETLRAALKALNDRNNERVRFDDVVKSANIFSALEPSNPGRFKKAIDPGDLELLHRAAGYVNKRSRHDVDNLRNFLTEVIGTGRRPTAISAKNPQSIPRLIRFLTVIVNSLEQHGQQQAA